MTFTWLFLSNPTKKIFLGLWTNKSKPGLKSKDIETKDTTFEMMLTNTQSKISLSIDKQVWNDISEA